MELGKMTISEAYPYLKSVALAYGLKLNRAKDFICTLSFKDLGITKAQVINRLITEKILPKNFHELKPTEHASRISC